MFGYMGLLLVLNVKGTNQFGGYGLAMWVMWTSSHPVFWLLEKEQASLLGTISVRRRYDDLLNVKTSMC